MLVQMSNFSRTQTKKQMSKTISFSHLLYINLDSAYVKFDEPGLSDQQ